MYGYDKWVYGICTDMVVSLLCMYGYGKWVYCVCTDMVSEFIVYVQIW